MLQSNRHCKHTRPCQQFPHCRHHCRCNCPRQGTPHTTAHTDQARNWNKRSPQSPCCMCRCLESKIHVKSRERETRGRRWSCQSKCSLRCKECCTLYRQGRKHWLDNPWRHHRSSPAPRKSQSLSGTRMLRAVQCPRIRGCCQSRHRGHRTAIRRLGDKSPHSPQTNVCRSPRTRYRSHSVHTGLGSDCTAYQEGKVDWQGRWLSRRRREHVAHSLQKNCGKSHRQGAPSRGRSHCRPSNNLHDHSLPQKVDKCGKSRETFAGKCGWSHHK